MTFQTGPHFASTTNRETFFPVVGVGVPFRLHLDSPTREPYSLLCHIMYTCLSVLLGYQTRILTRRDAVDNIQPKGPRARAANHVPLSLSPYSYTTDRGS